jgi:hypothetical protein
MSLKLPYLKQWDVTPCKITLHGGKGRDGAPTVAGTWSGKVNYSESARRVQNADGQWIQLAGVIHVMGDILPGVQFIDGVAEVKGYPERQIIGYSRPRNPDGTVNHTRLELV